MKKGFVFILIFNLCLTSFAIGQDLNSIHQRLESSDYWPEHFSHEENEFCGYLKDLRSTTSKEIDNDKNEKWYIYSFLQKNICRSDDFSAFKMSECLNYCNQKEPPLVPLDKKMNCIRQCDFVNVHLEQFLSLTKHIRMERDSLRKDKNDCADKKTSPPTPYIRSPRNGKASTL